MSVLGSMFRFLGALLEDLMLGDSFLGHGRRWESFAVLSSGYLAILLTVVPEAASKTTATQDLFDNGYGTVLTITIWALFIISFLGLFFNVRGIRYSQPLRIVGGTLGFLVWGWFGLKLALLGLLASPGHVLSILTAMYEVRVVFMAAANLPRPGAPGNLGLVRTNGSGAR